MISRIAIGTIAGLVLASATPAEAQEAPTAATAPETQPAKSVQPTEIQAEPAILSNSELDRLRGGESIVVTNQTLTAITSGNVINGNYAAGDVSLSDFALSNFNGLGNILINTGAQVSLQTGMNVTINVHP